MRRDIKYLVIKNDDSLLLYAATNIQAKEKDRYSDIKYSLRVIVELLIQFRKTSGKPNLKAKDLVLPKNYDDVLGAAKSITGYKGTRDIEKSNVFRKIGFCLSNLYVIVRSLAHWKTCQVTLEKCLSLLELYKDNWILYSNNALATYQARKANIADVLPNEYDVKKIRYHLIIEMQRLTGLEKLAKFTKSNYKELLNFTFGE